MSTPALEDITVLFKPTCYPHPVDGVTLIQTHISWVLLAGKFAYKIKKPVNLGFLDFSDLEKRHHFCTEELRLNKRLTPRMYLNVVPVVLGANGVRMGGQGEVIDYAIQMRRFEQDDRLDHMFEKNRLKPGHIDSLASMLANFHQHLPPATPDSPFGSAEAIFAPIEENFTQLAPLVQSEADKVQLDSLRAWSRSTFKQLSSVLDERKANGYVRECHGDLHLANLAILDKKIVAFDCLEFNPSLRWIDLMSEVAFLTMDLEQRGDIHFAARFLDAYLSITGDYAGLPLLRYYQVYRAMVRAKVAKMRLAQAGLAPAEREQLDEQFEQYTALAQAYVTPGKPALIIMHGISGAGKTVVSQRLLETFSAIRFRSDVERKRMFGVPPKARKGAKPVSGIYTSDVSEQTYTRLAELTVKALNAQVSVVVDAAFLLASQRAKFQQLAADANVAFVIIDCHAPVDIMKTRVKARADKDASDADAAVIEHQLRHYEPITDVEWAHCIGAETFPKFDERALINEVEMQINRHRDKDKH